MRYFTDAASRRWTITIDVYAIGRCRSLVGVDLYTLVGDGFQGLGQLISDPVKFADVLYILCEPDKANPPRTDEEFKRALRGDVFGEAINQFMAELVDFFPEPQRTGLKKVIEKLHDLEHRMAKHATMQAETVDTAVMAEEMIQQAKIKKTPLQKLQALEASHQPDSQNGQSEWSGESPVNSESTPAHSLSDS